MLKNFGLGSDSRLAGTWEHASAERINPGRFHWGTFLESWPASDSPAPHKAKVQLLRLTCELKVRVWAHRPGVHEQALKDRCAFSMALEPVCCLQVDWTDELPAAVLDGDCFMDLDDDGCFRAHRAYLKQHSSVLAEAISEASQPRKPRRSVGKGPAEDAKLHINVKGVTWLQATLLLQVRSNVKSQPEASCVTTIARLRLHVFP